MCFSRLCTNIAGTDDLAQKITKILKFSVVKYEFTHVFVSPHCSVTEVSLTIVKLLVLKPQTAGFISSVVSKPQASLV